MCAFIGMTFISVFLTPDPPINWALRKTILFGMTLLAATFVTTLWRARTSHAALLAVAALTSAVGVIQFAVAYSKYRATQQLADDPMILARMRGFMGHWLTFSSEQLLVWAAAIPAMVYLGRRWWLPITTVGTALILSFTRGVWLGAAAVVALVSAMMPKRLLLPVLLPLFVIAAAASGLIYHRVSASINNADHTFMPDTGRIELWKAGLLMIREHPWFGVGPERVEAEFPRHYRGPNIENIYHGHLENNFLTIAAERGLLCFATFLWFLLELYAGLFRLVKAADAATRWLPISGLAALTGFLVTGFSQFNFGDSEVLLLFLFVVSIPFGVLHERDVEEVI